MMGGQPDVRASKVVDVAQVSVPRLMFALLHQRFTGAMSVEQPPPHPGTRTAWFRGGMPVFTDWVEPTHVLGRVLISQKVIDEMTLLGALEAMAQGGGLLGQTLLQQAKIDAARLTEGLRRQCSLKMVTFAGLRAGQVTVSAMQHAVGEGDGLAKVNALEVIQMAVATHYDEERVLAEMGEGVRGKVQATAALRKYVAHFRFRPSDMDAVKAIAQGSQLAVLSNLPGMSPKRAAQLLYTLWACQMLRIAAPSRPVARAPAAAQPPAAGGPPGPQTPRPVTPIEVPGLSDEPASPPGAARPGGAAPVAPPTPLPADGAHGPPSISLDGPAMSPFAAAPQVAPSPPPATRPTTGPRPTAPAAPAAPSAARPSTGPRPSVPAPATKRKPRDRSVDHSRAPSGRHSAIPVEVPRSDSLPPGTDAELAKELRALEAKIAANAHAFEMFSLELDAKRKDVRRVWADLSRKFHPDAHASNPQLRDRVGEVFAVLSEAHQILSDAEQRQRLAEEIESGDYGSTKADATATARAAFEAELIFRDGEKLLRGNSFARALERFREAGELHADPSTEAAIAWCEYQTSQQTQQDATLANNKLSAIVEEAPAVPTPHYYRGFVLSALGHLDIAISEFSRAQELDPRLVDAERQARALRMKKKQQQEAAAGPPRRRGIRGLFGKK